MKVAERRPKMVRAWAPVTVTPPMVTLWTLPPVVRWVSVTQAAGSSPKTASGWAAENLS